MSEQVKHGGEIIVAGATLAAVWLNTLSLVLTILATIVTIAWGVWRFWKDPEFRTLLRWLCSWRKR